jgi:nitrate/nitrite transporter NarK
MAYVIAEPCVGVKDTACVDACPVDCIHPKKDDPVFETETQLYMDPMECIDCGACVSAFYFLTFGGFVAFSIYLPILLKDQFHLQPADAGFRSAGFVVLATLIRPVGGWLSDRIGGARALSAVFAAIVPFALLLGWTATLFTLHADGSDCCRIA